MQPTGVGVALAPLPENEWELSEMSQEFFFLHSCEHGILSLACLMRWRGVSRGWREKIHKSLPLLPGAVVDATDDEGNTPLLIASMRGLRGVVELLLAAGANVAAKNEAGNTAVERAQNAQTIEVLKAAGATMPEIPDEEKNTLLLEYAKKGLTGGVLMALQAGADANHKDVVDGISNTALHIAAFNGNHALAQAILGAGADVNARNWSSQTALHWAAINGHHALAQALLGAGADVNARDSSSETALHWAAINGHHALAQALLGAGTDVNAKNSNSETALHIAARCGHHALAQALLGAGADVSAEDVFGCTPLAFARAWQGGGASTSREMEALLRQHGADEVEVEALLRLHGASWVIRRRRAAE